MVEPPRKLYCLTCGSVMSLTWMEEDQKSRFSCGECGYVHYENPRILVTCTVEWEGKVLLCRRAIPPSVGRWTPPGGFMELDETLEEAVIRETREETGVIIEPENLDLYMVSSVPWMGQVYIGFRAQVSKPTIVPGPESLEARFFAYEDVPWSELAFPETAGYLEIRAREYREGTAGIHITRIEAAGGYRRAYRIAETRDVFKESIPTSRPEG